MTADALPAAQLADAADFDAIMELLEANERSVRSIFDDDDDLPDILKWQAI